MSKLGKKVEKPQMSFCCSPESKNCSSILTCLRYMHANFIKLRKTVYILHISIYRLLTRPLFFVAFCVFFLGFKHFLWPHDWPPENLKSESSLLCTIFSNTSWDSIKVFFWNCSLESYIYSQDRKRKETHIRASSYSSYPVEPYSLWLWFNYIDVLIFAAVQFESVGDES